MRITFVGHASILVESNGVRVLSDPWWTGPCFGEQWWIHPRPCLDPIRGKPVNYIYISSRHYDHFHRETLATLSRTSTVLVSRHNDLALPLQQLKFPVIEVSKDQEVDLGNSVKCRLMPTGSCVTLMVISDGRESCINLNDALYVAPEYVQDHFISLLKMLYAPIDYVFCGYGKASHFPDCYFIPGKDNAATAAKQQCHFNTSWARIVHGLKPKFAFPFAADVVLLENELFPLNEAVHNTERPTQRFLATYGPSKIQLIDIAPGFCVENGAIVVNKVRQLVSNEELKSTYKGEMERANHYGPVEPKEIEEVAQLLQENIHLCYPYLKTFPGNYRCLIQFRNGPSAVEITKADKDITTGIVPIRFVRKADYDLIYTSRVSYLKESLTTPNGHELLFMGSGGTFEYIDRRTVCTALHRELMMILQRHEKCPSPRYGDSGKLIYQAKHLAKTLLGRTEQDLYDLETRTVYQQHWCPLESSTRFTVGSSPPRQAQIQDERQDLHSLVRILLKGMRAAARARCRLSR